MSNAWLHPPRKPRPSLLHRALDRLALWCAFAAIFGLVLVVMVNVI